MHRALALTLPLILAACGAQPTPLMLGAARTEVSRDGRDYVVFLRGEAVEVIRLGYARRGEHEGIRETMIDLIEPATGCRPVASTLEGDSGELRGRVNCPTAKAP